uniref:Uncharacterized protein n=1 Tax=Pan paniscus TaxID=9597 RepID=A0A2R8ZPG0_PANPA
MECLINYLLFEKLLYTEPFNTMGKILQISISHLPYALRVSCFACVAIYLSSKNRIRKLSG